MLLGFLDLSTRDHAHSHCYQIYLQSSQEIFHYSTTAIMVLHGHLCKIQLTSLLFYFECGCGVVTILPFGHWRACCKLNILPHPQWLEIRFYLQPYLIGPYLIGSRSQKLYLFKFTRFLWSWELWAKKTHQLRDLDHIFFSHLSSFHFLWFQNVFLSIISHIFYLLLLMI